MRGVARRCGRFFVRLYVRRYVRLYRGGGLHLPALFISLASLNQRRNDIAPDECRHQQGGEVHPLMTPPRRMEVAPKLLSWNHPRVLNDQ